MAIAGGVAGFMTRADASESTGAENLVLWQRRADIALAWLQWRVGKNLFTAPGNHNGTQSSTRS
eukprot:4006991-Pyramimonas_sp.AAC.1